jgi:hypothetical protein
MLQDLYQNCSISNRIVVAESPSQHQNGKYYELEENHRLECLCVCVRLNCVTSRSGICRSGVTFSPRCDVTSARGRVAQGEPATVVRSALIIGSRCA